MSMASSCKVNMLTITHSYAKRASKNLNSTVKKVVYKGAGGLLCRRLPPQHRVSHGRDCLYFLWPEPQALLPSFWLFLSMFPTSAPLLIVQGSCPSCPPLNTLSNPQIHIFPVCSYVLFCDFFFLSSMCSNFLSYKEYTL